MWNFRKIILAALILSLSLFSNGGTLAQEEKPKPAVAADMEILLNFKDVSLETVLEYLSEVAGLVVVADDYLGDRLTVISRQPLNVDEAISLINTILKEKGYAAIRMGRILKIVSLTEAKKMNIPVQSGSDPEKIIPGDELVTHVIPIRFANAMRLREDLASLMPDYADLSANEDSNVLIITDTTANVRRLIEIVHALDTHMAEIAEVRVFHLKYADATNTAQLINQIFQEDQQATQRTRERGDPFSRMRRLFRGPGGEQSSTTDSARPSVNVSAAADERTNTVVVSAPSDVMEVVDRVIKDLDSKPGEELTIFTYHLKNAQADNLKTVLNNLFTEMANLSTRTSGQRGRTQRGVSSRVTGAQSITDLFEQVYIEADTDTNALLIMASAKKYSQIKEILDDLDSPVPQVLIKVLLVEVTHSDSIDIGIEFSMLNMRHGGDSSLFSTDFGLESKTEGLILRTIEGDVDVALHALEEVGRLDILSRPYILTSNNQTATITVGERVPFIRDTRITETGQTINTIQYEDIGIILEVTPHINPEGLVILDVKPEISARTAKTVPISERVNAAVFAKRSSISRVAVRDGQTIVIGGLVEDQLTETIKKVPLLGDIPILGYAFQHTKKEKEKTELLIFLTPHVATRAEELTAISEEEKSRSELIREALEPGVFEKHMEGMQGGNLPNE